MKNLKQILNFFGILFLLSFLLFDFKAEASTLYFEPETAQYHFGEVFILKIMLDTRREDINAIELINAAEIKLKFPPEKLQAIDVSKANSILILWPEEPKISNQNGEISFVAGVPNGFSGKGVILSIPFKVIAKIGEAKISFDPDSKILLNDGRASMAKLNFKEAHSRIVDQKTEHPKNEWEISLQEDKNPPEPFDIKINQDPLVFDGKYFVYFNVFDKETGIDYFEIKEGDREWKKISTPYLLEDQTLSSKIIIRAVDKAGNIRIAEWNPARPEIVRPEYRFYAILIVLIIFLAISILWIWMVLKRKKNKTQLQPG